MPQLRTPLVVLLACLVQLLWAALGPGFVLCLEDGGRQVAVEWSPSECCPSASKTAPDVADRPVQEVEPASACGECRDSKLLRAAREEGSHPDLPTPGDALPTSLTATVEARLARRDDARPAEPPPSGLPVHLRSTVLRC